MLGTVDFSPVLGFHRSADSDTPDVARHLAPVPHRALNARLLHAESCTIHTRGKTREIGISLELSRRAWDALEEAGLCDEAPPPPHRRTAGKPGHPAAAQLLPMTARIYPGLILAAERVREFECMLLHACWTMLMCGSAVAHAEHCPCQFMPLFDAL